ncbi:arsenate reductase (glutaredoxin) [Lysobacter humi (ex Lee et al. 2017)]
MAEIRLFHNPRCSKSREAHALLASRGVAFEEIRYLETPPTVDDLQALVARLGLPARALLRTSEDAYAALGLDDAALPDAMLLAAMAAHPQLIERPILVVGDRAVIGRPPERVLELLD